MSASRGLQLTLAELGLGRLAQQGHGRQACSRRRGRNEHVGLAKLTCSAGWLDVQVRVRMGTTWCACLGHVREAALARPSWAARQASLVGRPGQVDLLNMLAWLVAWFR